MNKSLSDILAARLDALRRENRLRDPRVLSAAPGAGTEVGGRRVVNFASNNYLDLAGEPRVVEAARKAMDQWGAGATASRLLGGTLDLHRQLEESLAAHKGTEAALVFPSGHHANVGALTALLGAGDTVVLDRLSHASLVDGARLSRARLKVFRHNDPEDLDRVLARVVGHGELWVVTESIFSMDGDRAPLREIIEVCHRRGARLYVDEAHGTGVWGPEGRGWVNALGLEKSVDVCMGTLSKALGAQGGFICGSRPLREWIQNKARSFIYSTALAPAAAAAALEALTLSVQNPAPRERVFALSRRFRGELDLAGAGPIVPLVVGGEAEALALSATLWREGFFAPAVRPPTVPPGTSRIRFSLTAAHTESEVNRVTAAVKAWQGRNPVSLTS